MIQAVRNDVKTIISHQQKPDNPALLFDRLCPGIDEPRNKESEQKEKVINKLITYYPSNISNTGVEDMHIYWYAFNQWCRYLQDNPKIIFFSMETCSPMVIGLGDQNVHEFGITLQLPWGTPVIPGTAVKGVGSGFAHKEGGENWHKGALANQTNSLSPVSGEGALNLFGGIDEKDKTFAGTVDFLPAWWVPDNAQPFIKDITTSHNRSYYQGGENWPDGTDSPMPNPFIVLQPGECFLFALKGPEEWTETAAAIVKKAAAKHGFGAKTRVGYGRFEIKTMEEFSQEIPGLNAEDLAKIYQTKKHIRSLSIAFQEAAINRDFEEILTDLFEAYRPETLLWSKLEALPDNPKWGKIKNLYESYQHLFSVHDTFLDQTAKENIYNFCLKHAPKEIPQWVNRFKPNAHELLADKDVKAIENLLDKRTSLEPTYAEFISAIKHIDRFSDDDKEYLVMYVEEYFEKS